MDPLYEARLATNRRHFFGRAATGIGTAGALIPAVSRDQRGGPANLDSVHPCRSARPAAFRPQGETCHLSVPIGRPSSLDLFDYKPNLLEQFDQELPDSIRQGQRLTGMTSGQNAFPDRAVDFRLPAARCRAARGSAS